MVPSGDGYPTLPCVFASEERTDLRVDDSGDLFCDTGVLEVHLGRRVRTDDILLESVYDIVELIGI